MAYGLLPTPRPARPVSSSRALCYPCHMPDDDVTAELERLRAENAQLKRTAN